MRTSFATIAAVALAAGAFGLAARADQGAGSSPAGAISAYGHFHDVPGAAYKPEPSRQYKIVFSVTRGAKTPTDVSVGLDKVARTVNLYTSAGVPLSHLHLVAVMSAEATFAALDNEHYKQKYGVDNPNLPVIAALKKAGVDVAVCGQAVADLGFGFDSVDKSITLAQSALTTVTTLQQQGYALMPL